MILKNRHIFRKFTKLSLISDSVLEKVEVDPLNRKLFYTDTGNDVIAVMNLDGTGYQQIVTTNLDEPREIVLDPRNQWVLHVIVFTVNGVNRLSDK